MLTWDLHKISINQNWIFFSYQTKSTHTQLFSISWTFWYLKWQVTELNWDVKESIKSPHHHQTAKAAKLTELFPHIVIVVKVDFENWKNFFYVKSKQQQLFDFWWMYVVWHKNGFYNEFHLCLYSCVSNYFLRIVEEHMERKLDASF